MYNHYAKFEYKEMKTVICLSYILHKLDTAYAFRMKKMSKFNTCKSEKIFIKCAQNEKSTSSMYEQSI